MICPGCGRERIFSKRIGFCSACIRERFSEIKDRLKKIHDRVREEFRLSASPPGGKTVCQQCVNRCGDQGRRYCVVRDDLPGRDWAFLSYYHDPLPTNCVASFACAGGTGLGYPRYSSANHPEYGYKNLAVFYHGCTFNCLFCQNWHFKTMKKRVSTDELIDAIDPSTNCVCFFGGDPTPFLQQTIEIARRVKKLNRSFLRICWETNGSMHPALANRIFDLAQESGGCVKIDLKAFSPEIHYALCGVSNRNTIENVKNLGKRFYERPDLPGLVVSTLLVPGYIDKYELERIAKTIGSLDVMIPWSLLGFYPQFKLDDLPRTSHNHVRLALEIAKKYHLQNVNIGNSHLLSNDY
ncbi:MAG TPA: radical SAM protein [bacterium (Candidatus Stahlbacteria)]|nr:radical SAM protein [Candidatus Stahlbacteria bacterium]